MGRRVRGVPDAAVHLNRMPRRHVLLPSEALQESLLPFQPLHHPTQLFPFLQAEKLDSMLSSKGAAIDRVLNFNVPDSLLVERVTGRLVHPASGRSYHTKFAPPRKEGVDDVTGEPLIRRKDDNAETLKARLEAFRKQTAPVIEHYRSRVVNIKGDQSADAVAAEVRAALNAST